MRCKVYGSVKGSFWAIHRCVKEVKGLPPSVLLCIAMVPLCANFETEFGSLPTMDRKIANTPHEKQHFSNTWNGQTDSNAILK